MKRAVVGPVVSCTPIESSEEVDERQSEWDQSVTIHTKSRLLCCQ